jgi:L-ascorbate metabolism protein UlaG (beta-lactamase superfamily)
MIYIIALLLLVAFAFFLIGLLVSAPVYKGPVTDHFDGRRFKNFGNVRAKGLYDVLKWLIARRKGEWKKHLTRDTTSKKALDEVPASPCVTFINHSSFLIRTEQVNILVDPVYSERVSPFNFIGPKRMRSAGLAFADLPQVHLVLISHNHYDHLDMPTIRRIHKKYQPRFIVPLGVKGHLLKEGISMVDEMDWWQRLDFNDAISVTSVPAQHFSGRGMLDRDRTLWCGYSLDLTKGKLYFTGDTGYNSGLFKMISERLGPIDLAIIPIGAYKPQWFMSPIHCSPEEAVRIHLALGSRKSIACHFGTFPLADDSQEDPVNDLLSSLVSHQLAHDEFIVLEEGETFLMDAKRA